MKLTIALAAAIVSISCNAQSSHKADTFASADVRRQLTQLAAEATAKGSSGATLADYGSHALKLSERTASGGAEIHAKFDDVFLVLSGTAKLITGGEVIDSHSIGEGETAGSGIRNGAEKIISSGDVVNIPAGTPHQLLIVPGATYSALVIKIKE